MGSLEDEANERTRLLRKEDNEWRRALIAKYKQMQGRPSEKAKPPKGPAVSLSTTCQEFYMISDRRQEDIMDSTKISIDIDGSIPNDEVAYVLRRLALKFDMGDLAHLSIRVFDSNGDPVGKAEIKISSSVKIGK